MLDAIDRKDWHGLAEELGDLQLQIVFQAEIACSEGLFDIVEVLRSINAKLVRRHPHVFESESLASADQVARRWEELKELEKPRTPSSGLLDGVARNQPAMLEAQQISKLAARAGFDWERFEDMGEKLEEEFREVGEARRSGVDSNLEHEAGNLLFMAVNVARYAGTDPEIALRRANAKFRERFGAMEQKLAAARHFLLPLPTPVGHAADQETRFGIPISELQAQLWARRTRLGEPAYGAQSAGLRLPLRARLLLRPAAPGARRARHPTGRLRPSADRRAVHPVPALDRGAEDAARPDRLTHQPLRATTPSQTTPSPALGRNASLGCSRPALAAKTPAPAPRTRPATLR